MQIKPIVKRDDMKYRVIRGVYNLNRLLRGGRVFCPSIDVKLEQHLNGKNIKLEHKDEHDKIRDSSRHSPPIPG